QQKHSQIVLGGAAKLVQTAVAAPARRAIRVMLDARIEVDLVAVELAAQAYATRAQHLEAAAHGIEQQAMLVERRVDPLRGAGRRDRQPHGGAGAPIPGASTVPLRIADARFGRSGSVVEPEP